MYRVVALFLCLSYSVPTFALTKSEAKIIYDADTKKLRAGDLQFDWKEYRLASVVSGISGGFDWHPVRTKFMEQYKGGDTQAAYKSASEIMNHNMAEPEGHLLAMMALKKLGKDQDAAFEHKVVETYLQSITASGDGKSSDTAYFVVNGAEEYFFLNIAMGVGFPASQSLVNKNGHSFDLLKIKDREGKEQEIWFNVDVSMQQLKNALGEK